jgi:hypothetical protein
MKRPFPLSEKISLQWSGVKAGYISSTVTPQY